ncbi:hypothetical protein HUK80_01215 [Flavobacterium sp. MAH-1]|uniref:Uncharacterized protein n=1 Tax=Flavobacterium agri TaxID=2743471 RepID=A0A7Y8Y052_9FLAO|nr:hypothetical protein [Flavobacterium agri]NUY79498.1 hypothetical protein [Flavobacterium agri]NYA69523.1 hypothetical protein [Flavobacterium agri]
MKASEILLQFDENKSISQTALDLLADEEHPLRQELVHEFRNHKNRDFALALLEAFASIRRRPYPENYDIGCTSLMFASYLLGMHGEISDCITVWQTKTIDFDTFCGFDIQLVPIAGIKPTIEFLKKSDHEDAEDALKYILECEQAGDFGFQYDFSATEELPWFI